MRLYGFWPPNQPLPQEPPQETTERARLEGEMADLRTPEQLCNELLKRTWLTQFQVDQVVGGFAHELNVGPYRLEEIIGDGVVTPDHILNPEFAG